MKFRIRKIRKKNKILYDFENRVIFYKKNKKKKTAEGERRKVWQKAWQKSRDRLYQRNCIYVPIILKPIASKEILIIYFTELK